MPKRNFASFVFGTATLVIAVLLIYSNFLSGILESVIASQLPKNFNAAPWLLALFIPFAGLTILSILLPRLRNQSAEQNATAALLPEQERYRLQRFISKVRRYWIEDYFKSSLYHTYPLHPILFFFHEA